MGRRDAQSFSSNDEETIESTSSATIRDCTNTIIADLARRLQERVEMEQLRSNEQPSHIPRRIAPEVEIEGMDVLLQALVRSQDMNTRDENCSSTCSNSLDSTMCESSSDDDSTMMLRRSKGRRRCSFRNRKNIGRHLNLEDELNVDSLRLTRKTMESKKADADGSISYETLGFFDDVSDTIVIINDISKSSLSAVPSGSGIASANCPCMNPIHYGNAAA